MDIEYESVIGLEVHVQLKTKSKIFSQASTNFGANPNTQACAVDLGLPGVLPVLNKEAVRMAITFGLAVGARIENNSIFARKNYFYPDLPKGYQISQYEIPIVSGGSLDINANGELKKIRITRAHLEEDAGKSIHDLYENESAIDLNRAGTPLIEIVSEPDMRSSKEAVEYLKKIHNLVRYLDICDGNMQEGSFRCDANVSLRAKGSNELGIRTEIKNLNSFKFVEQAINFEISRQTQVLSKGNNVIQETRLYDPNKNQTRSMRSKEEANDYRYFPDPDLLPLTFTNEFVDELKKTLPELPDVRKKRFIEDYDLSSYDSNILVSDKETADYFEAAAENSNPKLVCNWVIGELFSVLNKINKTIEDCPIKAEDLGELVNLIDNETITGRIAKDVFEIMLDTGENPGSIVDANNMKQVNDLSEIESVIDKIIENNPDQVNALSEKPNLIGWFVGQVMKETQGKANPKTVNEILGKKLLKKG